jgi:hypothetical protein
MSGMDQRYEELKKSLAAQRLSIRKTLASVEKVETTLHRSLLTTQQSYQQLDDELKSAAELVDAAIDIDVGAAETPVDHVVSAPSTVAPSLLPPPVQQQPPPPPPPPPPPHANDRVSIAMLIREPPLASLRAFIRYHFAIGIECIYLCFDDITNSNADGNAMALAASCSSLEQSVVVVHCHEQWFLDRQEQQQSQTWSMYGQYLQTDLIARQIMAVEHALQEATARGMDWLIHIDVDELLYWNQQGGDGGKVHGGKESRNNISQWFANIPKHVDAVRFMNMEAAPECMELAPSTTTTGKEGLLNENLDYFQEITLFKQNPSNFSLKDKRQHWPAHKIHFTAYQNGKSAVRCNKDVIPLGSHKFQSSNSPPRHLLSIDATDVQVMHYPHASFSLWWKKYHLLGAFPDYHLGTFQIPTGCFHLQSRGAVCGGGSGGSGGSGGGKEDARVLYLRHMVFDDEEEKAALMKVGLLVRNDSISTFIQSLLVNVDAIQKTKSH